MRNKEREKNWKEIRTLIIDEISMSSGGLFDTINILGKLIRENPAPFGEYSRSSTISTLN